MTDDQLAQREEILRFKKPEMAIEDDIEHTKEELLEELQQLEQEVLRREFSKNPIKWVEKKLGEKLWSKQKEILNALVRHRKVAVVSCHEIGKSFIAARAVGWWIDTHKPGEAFVVTSAPSGPQVRTILWREIGRVHAKGKLAGRVNQVEWLMPMEVGKEEQVAIGRKPNDYDPTSFQGIHARYAMYVFDEACGMPSALWESADSLIANDSSRALAIGNPDDPTSEFATLCKPGSGWYVVQIGAFDTPNFTGEDLPEEVCEQLIGHIYVEEKRRKWARTWSWNKERTKVLPPPGGKIGETGAVWQSKILGIFPEQGDEQGLIPISWIRDAQQRSLPINNTRILGLDVGGGGDESTCASNSGGVVRILWSNKNPDTMQTCGHLVATIHQMGASSANIDVIGIGRGVVDRALELDESVEGINVGEKALDEKAFANRRAELWWHAREKFETAAVDIDENDEDLADELASIRYKRLSNGKIQIESKDDAKKRGVASPNRADALMLALAVPKPKLRRATWGRRRAS